MPNVLSLSGLALKPNLPATPPVDIPHTTLALDLHIGTAMKHVSSHKQRQGAAKAVYLQVLQLNQMLLGEIAAHVQAVQCPHNLADSSAVIRLIVRHTPVAIAWAKAATKQPFSLGNYHVPASLRVLQQPVGTVQVMIQNPPAGYAKQGLSQCLLVAAGYTSEVEVVAEFLGGDNIVGGTSGEVPCLNTVIAWVRPQPGDRLLKHLPDTFTTAQGQSHVFVQGRPAGAQHLWDTTDNNLEYALHFLEQILPPDATRAGDPSIMQPQQQPQPSVPAQHPLPQPPPPPPRPGPGGAAGRVGAATASTAMDVDAEIAVPPNGPGDVEMQSVADVPPQPLQHEQQHHQRGQHHVSAPEHGNVAFLDWERSPAGDAVGYQAQQLSEERLERSLTPQAILQLKQQYFEQHQPLQGMVPDDAALVSWLSQCLQLPDVGYGEDSDGEPPTQPKQRQQQQQNRQLQQRQQQQQPPQLAPTAVLEGPHSCLSMRAAAGTHNTVAIASSPTQQQQQRKQPRQPNQNSPTTDAVAATKQGPRRSSRAGAGTQSGGFSQVFGRGFLLSPRAIATAPPQPVATSAMPGRLKGRPGL